MYKYGMLEGGTESDWDHMWNKYTTETVPQEQIKLLYGLANTKQGWLLNRYGQTGSHSKHIMLFIFLVW